MIAPAARTCLLLLLLCCSGATLAINCESNTLPLNYYVVYYQIRGEGTTPSQACENFAKARGSSYVVTHSDAQSCSTALPNGSNSIQKLINYTTSPESCGCADGQVSTDIGSETWCTNPPDPSYDPPVDPYDCQSDADVIAGNCGTFEADCVGQVGGTFGYIGSGSEQHAVCIPDGPTAEECVTMTGLECSNLDGYDPGNDGSGSSQNDPDDQTDNPDGTGVDDTQDNNTDTSDNGDTNGNGKCDADEPDCVPAGEKAEGECDPTASNYMECAGLIEDAEGLQDHLAAYNSDARDNAMNIIGENTLQALADDSSGIGEGSILENRFTEILPEPGGCADLGWTWKGHDFYLRCDETQLFRDVFGWFLYAYAAWSVISIAIVRPT